MYRRGRKTIRLKRELLRHSRGSAEALSRPEQAAASTQAPALGPRSRRLACLRCSCCCCPFTAGKCHAVAASGTCWSLSCP